MRCLAMETKAMNATKVVKVPAMSYEIDAAVRRLLAEALRPISEQVGQIQKQLRNDGLRGEAEYLSVAQVGELAGVAPGTVRRWIRRGQLASCKAGRSIRVKRADLEAFMSRDAANVEGVIDFKARAAELLSNS